jgi:hypothetical protein
MTTTDTAPAVPLEPRPAHWNIVIDVNGEPYPTRYRSPDSSQPAINLAGPQLDQLRAIHEAGHAVTVLLAGAHLHSAEIVLGVADKVEGGAVHACNLADGHGYATFCAAGERAADRWLREAGLWTPERAVANEAAAYGDRHQFLAINPHVGFGDREVDYRIAHDLADRALDQHWAGVVRVADRLAQTGTLDADEISVIAGMPNGSPSAKCPIRKADWWEEDPATAALEDRRYWIDRDED